MIPVLHKSCGGQVGWYKRDILSPNDRFCSQDFIRLDGTQPKWGELINERCPRCHKTLRHPKDFMRLDREPTKTDCFIVYGSLIVVCCLIYLTILFFLDCIP